MGAEIVIVGGVAGLARRLRGEGFAVLARRDARAAASVIRLVEEEQPALLVLDGSRADAGSLCRRLRERWEPRRLRLIALGVPEDAGAIAAAFDAGADEVIERTVPEPIAAARVAIAARRQRLRRLLLAARRHHDWPPGLGPVRLGPWRLQRLLGLGGHGLVFEGRRADAPPSAPPVAVKVMMRPFEPSDEVLARFRREAELLAGIEHENIVAPIEAAQHLGCYYYVMRYVDGGTLRALLEERGPLPESRVRGIGADLAAALSALARRGLVHRDVKPGNVLVERAGGRALLADFGLIKEARAPGITEAGFLIGTASYMAPERILDDAPADARSDLYSLGATLFHAAAGEPPFGSDASIRVLVRALQGEPPDLRARAPKVSRDLADIVGRLLAKDPGARFGSAEELLAAL